MVTMFVRGGKTIYAEKEYLFARLKVPGLAEKRPSILYSNSVRCFVGLLMCSYAWIPGSTDVEYEGRVYQTEKDSVLLLFYPGFHEIFFSGTKFKCAIHFKSDSHEIGRCCGFISDRSHFSRALDTAKIELVWPTKQFLETKLPDLDCLDYFDKQINREQRMAVVNMVTKTTVKSHFFYLVLLEPENREL